MATDTLPADTLQRVAINANSIYWDLHALLFSAGLILKKLEDDEGTEELRSLIGMAGMKALEMQCCFNPYIPRHTPDTAPAA